MEGRTRLVIAATLVLLGVGVVALGFLQDESTVRYVHDVHSDPTALASGSYTLMGTPQPEILDGAYNPAFAGSVPAFERRTDADGTYRITTYTTSVEELAPDLHRFTVEWRTTTGSSKTVVDNGSTTWDLERDLEVFQVDDFESGLKVWAAFGGSVRDGIQAKPSQLVGHVDPDAPTGLLLWRVDPDGYTAQCSSKFLPDGVRDQYDQDGDGVTD